MENGRVDLCALVASDMSVVVFVHSEARFKKQSKQSKKQEAKQANQHFHFNDRDRDRREPHDPWPHTRSFPRLVV